MSICTFGAAAGLKAWPAQACAKAPDSVWAAMFVDCYRFHTTIDWPPAEGRLSHELRLSRLGFKASSLHYGGDRQCPQVRECLSHIIIADVLMSVLWECCVSLQEETC